MKLNDDRGLPRYIDRHRQQAKRRGTRRQRKAYARIVRLVARLGGAKELR